MPKEAPMLRASVSLSRKISRDYNSTGYTVTLDGEVPFPASDNQGVLEKVSELFHLAEEALAIEIDRDQGEDAIGRRDEEPKPTPNNGHASQQSSSNGHSNSNGYANTNGRSAPLPMNRPNYSNGNNGHADAATPKQLQFLQTMAKRNKLNDRQLENRIGEVLGKTCGVNQLSKKEAGLIIDSLTGGTVRTGG
jgi:hypothetical protein